MLAGNSSKLYGQSLSRQDLIFSGSLLPFVGIFNSGQATGTICAV
jgi:hypothetical protein